jgi:hypothetical protein
MFSPLLSGRDHRGLHAQAFATVEAACIACGRNVRGGVLRSSHLREIAATGAKWPDEGWEASWTDKEENRLNEINDALAAEKQPPFLPWTISRIGGFYLPSTLLFEDEVRLMVKRHKGGRNDAKLDGADEYWPVPIGVQNHVCMIEVVEIMSGAHATSADVTAAVAGTGLSSVPIV